MAGTAALIKRIEAAEARHRSGTREQGGERESDPSSAEGLIELLIRSPAGPLLRGTEMGPGADVHGAVERAMDILRNQQKDCWGQPAKRVRECVAAILQARARF